MYYVYNFLLHIIVIVATPVIFLWTMFNHQGMRERLGFLPKGSLISLRQRRAIWFHAASMGEVGVVATVVPEVRKAKPNRAIVVSTMTTTGYQRAKQLIQDADLIFHAPLDVPIIIQSILHRLNPVALILTETEMWPNLILEARKFGSHIALINGRISPRSFHCYRLMRKFMSQVLAKFDLFCMQTSEDRDRIISLGANPQRTNVIGNLKFDLLRFLRRSVGPSHIRRPFCLSTISKVLVAGSTRPGEEEIIVDVYLKAQKWLENLVLILAPRHLKRIGEVEHLLVRKGVDFHRRTLHPWTSPMEKGVLLLDTMGELPTVYAIADLAFVGGSLVPLGGHNPLEPAVYGIPVLFGPYMDHTRESADLLLKAGGAITIEDTLDFAENVIRILHDSEERKQRGEAAFKAVANGCGASIKTVDLLIENGVI